MVPDVPESPTASPTRKEVAGSFGSASIELHPGYSDHITRELGVSLPERYGSKA